MPFKSAKQARFFYAKAKTDSKFREYVKDFAKKTDWSNLKSIAHNKVKPHIGRYVPKDPTMVTGVRG